MTVSTAQMRFWSPEVRELEPYVPGEQPKIQNLLKLNTNENPYPPSPKVVEAVQAVLDEISFAPTRFPILQGDVQLAPVGDFPYGVYYRFRSERIVVVAIYHQSRDPQGWQR